MLKDLISSKTIEARAIVGFYQANVLDDQEDDVVLYDSDGTQIKKLHMLRQ